MNIKPGVKKAVDRMQSSRALPAEAERCEVAQAAWPSEAEGQRGVSPPLCPPSSVCSRGTGPAQTRRCSGGLPRQAGQAGHASPLRGSAQSLSLTVSSGAAARLPRHSLLTGELR